MQDSNSSEPSSNNMLLAAQQHTIAQLSKRITQQDAEILDLKKKLAEKSLAVWDNVSGDSLTPVKNEEFIARNELTKLRERSLTGELTMEEARKLEIYAKILTPKPVEPKKQVFDTKKIDTQKLLAAMDEAGDDNV